MLNGTVNASNGPTTSNLFQYSTGPAFAPTVTSTLATYSGIAGIATDAAGNVYVGNGNTGQVREFAPDGSIVATFSTGDSSTSVFSAGDDGVATGDIADYKLIKPNGSVVSLNVNPVDLIDLLVGKGDNIYTAYTGTGTIYDQSETGSPQVVFSSPTAQPDALAIDPAGNVYFQDLSDDTIKEIVSTTSATTIATGISEVVSRMTFDTAGNLYVVTQNHFLKILPDGTEYDLTSQLGSGLDFAAGPLGDLYTAGSSTIGKDSVPSVVGTPANSTGSSTGNISAVASGLTKTTNYYFRAVADTSNPAAAFFGATESFTTLDVAHINSVAATSSNGTYGLGSQITIDVNFNGPVAVTGTPQLALDSGGTANYVSGTNSSTLVFKYTVGSGDSTSMLDYSSSSALSLNGGTITANGDNAALTLSAPGAVGSISNLSSIAVDTVAPTLQSNTPNLTTDTGFAPITYTLKFSKPVTNATLGSFDSIGTAPVTIQSVDGNGTSTLTVTVQPDNYGTVQLRVRSDSSITDTDIGGNLLAVPITDTNIVKVIETPSLVVTSAADGVNPYDDAITLADAVAYANTLGSGTHNITFAPDLFIAPGTITLANTLVLNDSGGTINITGPSIGLTISGDNAVGVFKVDSGTTADLSDLTIANGSATQGAGIDNQGNLTVQASTFTANIAPGSVSAGGGIANVGSLFLGNCTFYGNTAAFGGGVANFDGYFAAIKNCTFSGNTATDSGGGILSQGDSQLINDLVSGNTADTVGNELYVTTTPGLEFNNLFGQSGETAPQAFFGGFTPVTSDIVATSDGTKPTALSAIVSSPPVDNGGPTATMALVTNSPAIGAGIGKPFGTTTDQRGLPRHTAPDIGAYEFQRNQLVVTTVTDENNGSADPSQGTGTSLREAIIYADTLGAGLHAITFDPTVFASPQTISLSSALGDLEFTNTSGTIAITAPAAGVTIDGNKQVRIFQVDQNAAATLTGLTIANGVDGVTNNPGGTLTVNDCTFSGNSGAQGGAINNSGSLAIDNSTFTDNSATQVGGAINTTGSQLTTIANSTFTGNTSSGAGGAVNSSLGNVEIDSSTFVGNGGASGGAIRSRGTMVIRNSLVAGNTATSAGAGNEIGVLSVAGGSMTESYNLVGNAAETAAEAFSNLTPATTDLVETSDGGNVALSAIVNSTLAPNGGPTQTLALPANSPAINAADPNYASTANPLTTDQRGVGFPRISGGRLDMGAFELQQNKSDATINISGLSGPYNGKPQPASGTATGVGATPPDLSSEMHIIYSTDGKTFTPSAPVNAGTYEIYYTFDGDASYNAVSTPVDSGQAVVIGHALPMIAVSAGGGMYTGGTFTDTATIAGVVKGVDDTPSPSLETVGLALDYINTDTNADLGSTEPAAVGDYKLVASFSGSTDYSSASNSAPFSITEAGSSTKVVDVGGPFTGSTYPATSATATGVGGLNDSNLPDFTFVYVGTGSTNYTSTSSAPSGAGTYLVTATYAGDANHSGSSNSAGFTISPASASVSLVPASLSQTYDGKPKSASATTTPAGLQLQFSYASGSTPVSAPTDAGSYNVTVNIVNSNYTGSAADVLVINKASALITVNGVTATFDTNPHPATATATGVESPNPAVLTSLLHLSYKNAQTNAVSTSAPIQPGAYEVFASFDGNTDYNAVASFDTGKQVTINAAAPNVTFSNLASPTIIYHTFATTLSGKITSQNSLAGGLVSINLNGVTKTSKIDSKGMFSAIFDTRLLRAGTYSITYAYTAGGITTSALKTLTVTYNCLPLFNNFTAYKAGSTIPVVFLLQDAIGLDVNYTATSATATGIAHASSPNTILPLPAGSSPGGKFSLDKDQDEFSLNLKTTGLASGTYKLYFAVGGDPVTHSLTFNIR